MTTPSIPSIFYEKVKSSPDTRLFTFVNADESVQHFSCKEFHSGASEYAYFFEDVGVKEGEAVLLALDLSPDLLYAYVGLMYIGACPIIYPYVSSFIQTGVYQNRLQQVVSALDPKLVLTEVNRKDEVAQLTTGLVLAKTASYEGDDYPFVSVGGEQTAYIQLSSGTTGVPKGLKISHSAIKYHCDAVIKTLDPEMDQLFVGWTPFYHDMGLLLRVCLPLVTHVPSAIIETRLFVRKPSILLKTVSDLKGTVTFMPNFGFKHCTRVIRDQEIEGYDLSSWQAIVSGSEPVDHLVMEQFVERFSDLGVKRKYLRGGYGLAECTTVVSATTYQVEMRVDRVSAESLYSDLEAIPTTETDKDTTTVVSCGPPLPGNEIMICDEDGNQLPERSLGEIVVKSPWLFSGYWGTHTRSDSAVQDGWLKTGDIGYLVDGELYICDRIKDLIITAGRNITPSTIEAIATDVMGDNIRRAAAFGIYNEQIGTEEPSLVIEYRANTPDDAIATYKTEIENRVKTELGIGLGNIKFVERGWLELTTSGKVSHKQAKEKYLAEEVIDFKSLSTFDTSSAEILCTQLIDRFKSELSLTYLNADHDLFEIGVDSIQVLSLLHEVETSLGMQLPIIGIIERLTINAVVDAIVNPQPLSPPGIDMNKYPPIEIGPLDESHPHYGVRYSKGIRLIDYLARNRKGGRVDAFEQVAPDLPHIDDPEAFIYQSKANYIWFIWQSWKLSKMSDKWFWEWVSVKNRHLFDEAQSENRPVIIAIAHYLGAVLAFEVIRRLGVSDYYGIGYHPAQAWLRLISGDDIVRKLGVDQNLKIKDLDRAQYLNAIRTLDRNQTLVIPPDSGRGTTVVQRDFLGRVAPFNPMFSTLAKDHNAIVLPMFIEMHLGGKITVHFYPRFQHTNLVDQYVTWAENLWQEYPTNIHPVFYNFFRNLPFASPEKTP